MPRKKGTPAKRTGGEKKSQGATPKKPKVTKVAPQTKAAIKKVVDKGIHNMRYAPIEENLTGRTELPEKYGGPEPKPERKSKKPNPLKESTVERIERENLEIREKNAKRDRARADSDRFKARVENEDDYKEAQKKRDRKKARKTKMSAQGRYSETVTRRSTKLGTKKMSAPASPKMERKPYVKKVEPSRTTSGKRWFDITPTSEQSEVGKKPEAKVRSLHKNARIKGLVDLREITAANMKEGEAQRLKEAQRKLAEKKKAQRLTEARKNKKPTKIKKKGSKMAGRPKKTKASVDAKLAKAEELYTKNLEEGKKGNTPKKSTASKVTVEATEPKTTKKPVTPKKPVTVKPETAKPKTTKTKPKPTKVTKPKTTKTKTTKPAVTTPKADATKVTPPKTTGTPTLSHLGTAIKETKVKPKPTAISKVASAAKWGARKSGWGMLAMAVAPTIIDSAMKVNKWVLEKEGNRRPGANKSAGKDSKGKPFITPMTISGQSEGTKKNGGSGNGGKYRVEHGDTLSGIAKKAGVTLAELRAANPKIVDPKKIYRNTPVNIPKGKKVPEGGYKGPVPYKGK